MARVMQLGALVVVFKLLQPYLLRSTTDKV
jgi:hypothetical protein